MSYGRRNPRLTTRGRPVDKVVHPKAGRKNGERTRKMMDQGKRK